MVSGLVCRFFVCVGATIDFLTRLFFPCTGTNFISVVMETWSADMPISRFWFRFWTFWSSPVDFLHSPFWNSAFEIVVFREIRGLNVEMSFSFLFCWKELTEPVILRYWMLESVHGAWRTVQKRISRGAHAGSGGVEGSEPSNLPDPALSGTNTRFWRRNAKMDRLMPILVISQIPAARA